MKKTFNIALESDYEIDNAIQLAVKEEVKLAISSLVNETVKIAVEQAVLSQVEDMVKEALRTRVQIFNYDGSVKDERSFEDAMKAALKEVTEQGVQFKIKTGSYSSDNKTIADVIKDDLYSMMTKRLKPFFDKLEAEFQEKSQAKLREFALAAIDNSNKKVLSGF